MVKRTAALTPRLKLVYDFVRPDVSVADIGTDHAYLAAALVSSGKCPRCIACDLNPGPLGKAAQNVGKYGLTDRIELRLSDGLDAVAPADASDIVIAGMGGELIFKIIARCGWLKDSGYRLVLQPMTACEELRGSLCESGFEIKKEAVAKEGNKYYLVISAAFTGRISAPTDFFKKAGLLPRNGDTLSRGYLIRQAQILGRSIEGRKMAANGADVSALEKLAVKLKEAAENGCPE